MITFGRRGGRTQEAVDEIVEAFKRGDEVLIARNGPDGGVDLLRRVSEAVGCDLVGQELRGANGGRVSLSLYRDGKLPVAPFKGSTF